MDASLIVSSQNFPDRVIVRSFECPVVVVFYSDHSIFDGVTDHKIVEVHNQHTDKIDLVLVYTQPNDSVSNVYDIGETPTVSIFVDGEKVHQYPTRMSKEKLLSSLDDAVHVLLEGDVSKHRSVKIDAVASQRRTDRKFLATKNKLSNKEGVKRDEPSSTTKVQEQKNFTLKSKLKYLVPYAAGFLIFLITFKVYMLLTVDQGWAHGAAFIIWFLGIAIAGGVYSDLKKRMSPGYERSSEPRSWAEHLEQKKANKKRNKDKK